MKIAITIVALLAAVLLRAQPTVSSFTPTSGAVGTTVTITGTGFSATPANNIVLFGATKASVSNATATQLTVTVPAGATYRPVTVTVGGLVASSKSPFLVTFQSISEITSGSLATRVDFAINSPRAVALGDLDGDGKVDIAVTNGLDNTVSIFRNTSSVGSITTGSLASKVDYASGSTAYDVEIGDLDRDGKQELVYPNVPNLLSVRRNLSSSGSISFDANADFSVSGGNPGPFSGALADFDGDGKPDLVTASNNLTKVTVFRGLGAAASTINSGSFASGQDFTTGNAPYFARAGDIDGDGKPDIVVANFSGGTISILRNTSSVGSISFAAKVDVTVGANPYRIAIGDLDADSKLDVAVPNFSSNTISVLKNNSSSGSITMATKVDFSTNTPNGVAISDIDGDGKPDLAAVSTSGTLSILKNTSTPGTISSGSFAAEVTFTTGSLARSVAVGDIDGDGKNDVVVANESGNSISIFRNLVTGPTITGFSPQSGPIGTSVVINGTGFSSTPSSNAVYFGATKANVSASSTTQLTVTVPTGASYRPVSITANGLTATSSNSFDVTFTTEGTYDYTSFLTHIEFPAGTAPYYLDVGDIDLDGKADLAVTNSGSNSVSIYRNTSNPGSLSTSSFAAKVDFTTGTNPQTVVLSDIDGDGKRDLLVANSGDGTFSVFRNTSTPGTISAGSFASNVDFSTGVTMVGLAVGDIDGDGKSDVVATRSNGGISVFRNTCTIGSVTAASFAVKVDFTSGAAPEGAAIGDLDGDGRRDIVVTNRSANTMSLFRNIGTSGVFTASSLAAKVDISTAIGPSKVILTDLDLDGKLDIEISNPGTGSVSVYRNTSAVGTLTTGSLSSPVNIAPGAYQSGISSGDIDGDGKPDLAMMVANFIRNTSTPGTISPSTLLNQGSFSVGTQPYDVVVADLDGDSRPDIAFADRIDNTVSVVFNRGPIPAVYSFAPEAGPVGSSITISGNNFSTTNSNNTVYFGATKATVTTANETQLQVTIPSGATCGPITVEVNGLSATSFTNFDVTFSSSASLNGSAFPAHVEFNSGVRPYFMTSKDMDGDGKPDVVVTNDTDNTVSVFRNTASAGSISASSFAAHVDFATGAVPSGVAVADLDGDTKPDIITANLSANTLSILRNTSSTGSITLAGKVDLATGGFPIGVASGDFDGDGKVDIAVTNGNSNSVSVWRNGTVPGTINSVSFGSRVDFGTGLNPKSVATGDINGDGLLDLVVLNNNSGTVSVLENQNATPGLINSSTFATKVDFTTGTNPYRLILVDVDGDSMLDIVVVHYSAQILSIFRNTGSPGTIYSGSFAARVDFSTTLGVYDVAQSDLDGDGRPDLVCTTDNDPNHISIFRNTATPGVIGPTSLATRVDISDGSYPVGIAINDLDGDGPPEIIVTNLNAASISVFRNTINAPIITDFSPPSGPIGTQVIITGSSFDPIPSNNIVKFNGTAATVVSSTANSVTTSVPAGATTGKITVTVGGVTATSTLDFTVTSTASDTSPPTVTTRSPVDGATSVPVNTNLVLTFSEAIQKGTGNILIKKGSDDSILQTIDVTNSNVTITNATLTINPSDLLASTGVYVNIATTAVKDLAGNNFAGISDNSSWNFTTSAATDTSPPAVSHIAAASVAPNTNLSFSVTFTDLESGIATAAIQYWPTTGTLPTSVVNTNLGTIVSGTPVQVTIPSGSITELGVEYKFLVQNGVGLDNGASITTFKTAINHASGLALSSYPASAAGKLAANYRIIAIPLVLQNKTANSVFGGVLGNYDPKVWRMFKYDGSRFTELNGTTNLLPGEGYWFISSSNSPLNTGAGTTVDASTASPFTITLNQGWNQIGNPYNFNISWADVIAANPTQTANLGGVSSKIRVFRGSISNEDVLKVMEGGFVKFTGTSGTAIKIPVTKNTNIQGRISAEEIVNNALDYPAWEVGLKLRQGTTEYNLGGFGMRPDAKEEFDYYDDFNAPRFIEYLEVRHPKKFFGMSVTKDIVPTSENHVWNFAVESNLEERVTSISWDNSNFGSGKEIFLLDVATFRITDMRSQSHFEFDTSVSKDFKVVFGHPDFVKKELIPNRVVLMEPYPNPFSTDATVDYSLPEAAAVEGGKIEIYNSTGIRVSDVELERKPGNGSWIWSGEGQAAGLYFVRLKVGTETTTRKIVKTN